MSHEFVKTTWNNGASPAITAEQLNRIEDAIDESIDAINDLETGKQDELTFDSTPTVNSQNPVTSGGIKQALDAKANLASPTFTGMPKVPTPAESATQQIANVDFVTGITGPIANRVSDVEDYTNTLKNTVIPGIDESIGNLQDNVNDLESAEDKLAKAISTNEETMTATKNYAVGDLVMVNNQLYRVMSPIASGSTLTPSVNIITTTIDAELDTLEAEVEDQIPAVDNTLAVAGAAADAKKTGDELTILQSAFTVTESTNLCNPDNLETGLLNSSGIVDSSYTTRLTTEFIETNGLYVSAYCHQTGYNDIGSVRIAFYNSDKFLKNIIITSPAITLPVDGAAYIRVTFATNWAYYFVGFSSENAKIPFAKYFDKYLTINEKALPARITATDNWLYKFAECDFVGGNVHLSIDDVGAALYYLAINNPASLWDSVFFSQLKTLHDTYGVCITCNCFSYLNTLQDYDIAAVPNTWASDFVGAKSWLKFAFHAKNNTINYSSAETLKTDYEYFVSAIYHMTSDYDCIDTGTRITMFTGAKTQIEQVMNIAHGITMLWTADDDRDSYYFDAAQTARTNSRGKYIDDIVGMLFVKSMPRLDNHTIDDIAILISGKPQYGKMVELYCHENLSGTITSGTITRINGALTWFKENGYNSHFLSDIFK